MTNLPNWPPEPVLLMRKDHQEYLTDRATAEAIVRKDVYARADLAGNLHVSSDPTEGDEWAFINAIDLHYADNLEEWAHPLLLLPVLETALLLSTLETPDSVAVHTDTIRMLIYSKQRFMYPRAWTAVKRHKLSTTTSLQQLIKLSLENNPHVERERMECEPDAILMTRLEGPLAEFMQYVENVLEHFLTNKLLDAVTDALREYVESMNPMTDEVFMYTDDRRTRVNWEIKIEKVEYVLPRYDIDELYKEFRVYGKDVPTLILDRFKLVFSESAQKKVRGA